MRESYVFLLVIIYSFREFVSVSAYDPQSCVCTAEDHLHTTQNALNQVMLLTGADDVAVVRTFPLRCDSLLTNFDLCFHQ